MLHSRINPYWRESRTAQAYYRKKDQWPVPPQLEPGQFFPVDPELTKLFGDDEDTSAPFPGERILLALPNVHFIWPDGGETRGTLRVTIYRLFFIANPTNSSLSVSSSLNSSNSRVLSKRTVEPMSSPFRHLPFDIVIPMGLVEKVESDPKLRNQRGNTSSCNFYIDFSCKDASEYRFGFPDADHGDRTLRLLDSYCFSDYRHIYCFHLPKRTFFRGTGHNPENDGKSAFIDLDYKSIPFKPTSTSLTLPLPAHLDGWRFYDPVKEYTRMNIPNQHFRISNINKDYSICETYPSILCLPNLDVLNDRDIRAVASFRSKGRIPSLVWKNPTGDQTIWRCAQPGTGMTFNRCLEDEKLVHFIGKSNPTNSRITIIDARPKTNAQANAIKGFGFESESNYPFAKVRFMNIENIHDMRTSYRRLVRACVKQKYDSSFSTEVIHSLWLKHSADILKATAQIVSLLDIDGSSVLIHCSDGWDRTAQLSSLSKLCVDPYYRTIRGFMTLIDHEWLAFGHKFQDRYGHFLRDLKDERSPVFIQFLDCVYQLLVQFPRHFEFTSEFLATIAHHSFTCRFGTFLFNCERDRMNFRFKPDQLPTRIADVSVSLWTYLLTCPKYVQGHFTNALYAPFGAGDALDLYHEFSELLPQFQPEMNETSSSSLTTSPSLSTNTSNGAMDDTGPEYSTSGNPSLSSSSDPSINDMAQSVTETPTLTHLSGTILYPSYNAMKLELWSCFFLRSHLDVSNEFYHFNRHLTGNIWPGRATSASLLPSHAMVNNHLHWSTKLGTTALYMYKQQQQYIEQLKQQQIILEYQLLQSKRLIYNFEQKFGPLPQTDIDQISVEVNMLYQHHQQHQQQHDHQLLQHKYQAIAPLYNRIPQHPLSHLLEQQQMAAATSASGGGESEQAHPLHPLASTSTGTLTTVPATGVSHANGPPPPIPARNKNTRSTTVSATSSTAAAAAAASSLTAGDDVTTTVNPLAVLSASTLTSSTSTDNSGGGEMDWTDLLQTNPSEMRQNYQKEQQAAKDQQQVLMYNAQYEGLTSLFSTQQPHMELSFPSTYTMHVPQQHAHPPKRVNLMEMELQHRVLLEQNQELIQQQMQYQQQLEQLHQQQLQQVQQQQQQEQGHQSPTQVQSSVQPQPATASPKQEYAPSHRQSLIMTSELVDGTYPEPRSFATSFSHNPFDLASLGGGVNPVAAAAAVAAASSSASANHVRFSVARRQRESTVVSSQPPLPVIRSSSIDSTTPPPPPSVAPSVDENYNSNNNASTAGDNLDSDDIVAVSSPGGATITASSSSSSLGETSTPIAPPSGITQSRPLSSNRTPNLFASDDEDNTPVPMDGDHGGSDGDVNDSDDYHNNLLPSTSSSSPSSSSAGVLTSSFNSQGGGSNAGKRGLFADDGDSQFTDPFGGSYRAKQASSRASVVTSGDGGVDAGNDEDDDIIEPLPQQHPSMSPNSSIGGTTRSTSASLSVYKTAKLLATDGEDVLAANPLSTAKSTPPRAAPATPTPPASSSPSLSSAEAIANPLNYLPTFDIKTASASQQDNNASTTAPAAVPPKPSSTGSKTHHHGPQKRAPMPIPVNVLGDGEYGYDDSDDEDDE